MTSFDKRGADDRLLSPDNAVLTIIDYHQCKLVQLVRCGMRTY